MGPVVTATDLVSMLDGAQAVAVVHVGTALGRRDPYDDYLLAHLPDARFVSLETDLAGPPSKVLGRHPLPSPDHFAAALGAIGIGVDAAVVAYDARNGAFASRLVWMLRIIGQDAALLDGGMPLWSDGLVSGPVEVAPIVRAPIAWPSSAIADSDDVANHLAAFGVVIDSREALRYRGDDEPIDAVAGHIPGAINLPFVDNIDHGRLRSSTELRRRFMPVADDPDAIVYCGSGVTACHNALAIESAGFERPRVYVGSWSGWSTETGRRIATGE